MEDESIDSGHDNYCSASGDLVIRTFWMTLMGEWPRWITCRWIWFKPGRWSFRSGLHQIQGYLLCPISHWRLNRHSYRQLFRTPIGALVKTLQVERLFAPRVNVKLKDCATMISITRLPQLPSQSSLVRQSIFAPRTWMASSPKNTRTFNPSMWETWISLSFSGNTWRRLICLTRLPFLSGLTPTSSVCWIDGVTGRQMGSS